MITIEANRENSTVCINGTPWDVQAELQLSVVKTFKLLSAQDGLPIEATFHCFLKV